MKGTAGTRPEGLWCQADESAPAALTIGLGLQLAALTLAVPILVPTAVMRTGGASESYLAWAVFAAVAISGATTALQAVRYGRIGGGQMLVMGSSGAFIGISMAAVATGGPAMLATLVIFAALFQVVISVWLPLFRRMLTPVVSGTVIMLVPVTVMPIVFDMLEDVPEGTPTHAGPVVASVSILVVLAVTLKGTAVLRLWAPMIGIVAGTLLALPYGLYDLDRISAASWIGIPSIEIPGLDLDFGPEFWVLLPAFLLTALITSARAIGSSAALQRVSWRSPRPVDFRATQGTVMVDGVGNLLCGVTGTAPNTTYSVAAPLVEISGVAARSVAVATGAIFLVAAFLPKAMAIVLAVPGPVTAAYLFVLIALLFTIGIRMAMQDGMNLRNSTIVGISFWLGTGFQTGAIYPDIIAGFAGGIFANGITSGGLVAIVLSFAMDKSGPRPARMKADLDVSALPNVRKFLDEFAARNGWDGATAERLADAGEAALSAIHGSGDAVVPVPRGRKRRLRLSASRADGAAVLEFIVAPRKDNIQDWLARLDDPDAGIPAEQRDSLRLLKNLVSSVRHQQYHDLDIVTVAAKPAAPGE